MRKKEGFNDSWIVCYMCHNSQQVNINCGLIFSLSRNVMIVFVWKACGMRGFVTVCIWMLLLHLSWGRAIIRDQNGNTFNQVPDFTSSKSCSSAVFLKIIVSVTGPVHTILAFSFIVIQCSCQSNQQAFSYHVLFSTTTGILRW